MGVVSTYALVVDDLDDGGQAAGEGAVALEEDNTANLDEAPVGCDNGGVTHFCGVLRGCGLVGEEVVRAGNDFFKGMNVLVDVVAVNSCRGMDCRSLGLLARVKNENFLWKVRKSKTRASRCGPSVCATGNGGGGEGGLWLVHTSSNPSI